MKPPHAPTRTTDVIRGLGALITLTVLLGGVPAGLLAVAGSPVPHAPPTWSQITVTLTQPDTGNSLFLATVKVIGWSAWCLFAVATLTECASYLRGRPTRRLPQPIRPLQHLARDLVTMIALMITTAAPLAGVAPASPHPTATTTAVATSPAASTATVPVAAATLADRHHPTLPGADRATETGASRPWRIYIIKSGDTLWAIARYAYGTGTEYPAIFNASKALEQPPGLPRLTDPNRIYPEQRITIPLIGETPGHHPPPTNTPPTRSTQHPIEHSQPPTHPSPTARFAAPPTAAPHRPPSLPRTPTSTTTNDAPRSTPHPSPDSRPPGPTRPNTANPEPVSPRIRPAPTTTTPKPPGPLVSNTNRTPPATVTLPTDAYIGLSLAAAISVALAATRLHRRRRRTQTDEWPTNAQPDPAPPEPVANAHRAHLDTYAARGDPIPSDADLVAQDLTRPAPTQIVAGVRNNQNLILTLAGLNLGLTGPGAPAVIRTILTELLAKSHRYRAELIIPASDTAAIFAGTGVDPIELAETIAGLIVTPSLEAAITHLEAEIIHRARLMETADESDVSALREADPGEPLPAIIVVASVPTTTQALNAILQFGHPYCVGGLLLGPWPAGTTVNVATDGTVTDTTGPNDNIWKGSRLFHLTPGDTGAMMQTIRTANGAPETDTITQTIPRKPSIHPHSPGHGDPSPSRPAPTPIDTPIGSSPHQDKPAADTTHPRPVHLHVLGHVRVEADGKPITTGLRRITRDLLTYLALHPDGITREQGVDALQPDRDLDTGTTMFHTAINNARKTLRAATALREPMFINHTDGRYRLDPNLIDVDLWQLRTTLKRAQHAADTTTRIDALRLVLDLYTAELADDLAHEWVETEREQLRRHATDALTQLAHLIQNQHPEQALTALEHALEHDPYAEPIYRDVMRLQTQLGNQDATRRTYQLLIHQLANLDLDPSEETHQLLADLLRSSEPRIRNRPPGRSSSGDTVRTHQVPNGNTPAAARPHPRD